MPNVFLHNFLFVKSSRDDKFVKNKTAFSAFFRG